MAEYYWRYWCAGEPVPAGAVQGGHDIDSCPIYVGRANYQGDMLPAKVMPAKNVVYVPFSGQEITLENCEILCQKTFKWVHTSGGDIPYGSVHVGSTSSGEPLYAGRVFHEGSHCVGKVHPSHGVCYVPFGGGEHSHHSYEILVLTED